MGTVWPLGVSSVCDLLGNYPESARLCKKDTRVTVYTCADVGKSCWSWVWLGARDMLSPASFEELDGDSLSREMTRDT